MIPKVSRPRRSRVALWPGISCDLRVCGRENGAADYFGDLWDDGVAESAISVQPTGNPISHSTHSGFFGPRCPIKARSYSRKRFPPLLFFSRGTLQVPRREAVGDDQRIGRGNDKNSVAKYSGTSGGRRNTVPRRIEPARGQVTENSSKPKSKQSCDVFHKSHAGSNLAKYSGEFRPKSAAIAVKSAPPIAV